MAIKILVIGAGIAGLWIIYLAATSSVYPLRK